MDHLTPVKTALLVERQTLSACRGKCYAASQFSLPPCTSPSLLFSPFSLFLPLTNTGSLSLSSISILPLNLSQIPILFRHIHLYFSFSHIILTL
ncbi:hypothetical protein EXN66_Car006486 [Channa argus]|uniref:Uncharacterized protein n=1 Tax=Channa argus TaxID=215402 RepID=A0A6G1PKN6_CHAAH|nr:hypothetical protein EXN66_Car006486 [Channa argus]